MRRLAQTERKGLKKLHLVVWGLVFMLAGVLSRSILQIGILDMNTLTGEQLLEKISASTGAMAVATAAIVMQAVEACAIPVFAFLVVNGFHKAKNENKLLLCLLVMALVSEIPYNLAMYGKLLHMETRNPALALVIGLAVLYFFRRFGENSFANVLIKLFIGIAAVLWATMLRVEHGLPVLIVMMTMWALRDKKAAAILFGGAVASGCVLFSPLYIGAALGILPVYFYREEEEETEMPLLVYAVYPAALAAFGLVSIFL